MGVLRATQESCSATVELDLQICCLQVLVGGRDDQDVFMVMEFLEHDLKGLLEQGRLKDFGPSDVSILRLNAGDSPLQMQDTAAGAEVPEEASALNKTRATCCTLLCSQSSCIGLRKACPGLAWCISLWQPRVAVQGRPGITA